MLVYTFYSPSHRRLLEDYLAPSVKKSGFILEAVEIEQICTTGSYYENGWTETMRRKLELLKSFSEKNRDQILIYSDCDVIFNSNNFTPEIAAQDLGENFLAMQDDIVQSCAGFMIIKGCAEFEKLIDDTLSILNKCKDDQTAINRIINSRSNIKIGRLPQKEYACPIQFSGWLDKNKLWNGRDFTLPDDMKIFHGNWTKGVEQKENLLRLVLEKINSKITQTFELETPVAFLIFNRPHETRLVFNEIRKIKPKKLFIVADGPRPEIKNDSILCTQTREIVSNIDWPCEVRRDYADTNLGCGKRVSSGLNWIFEQVDEAIILEDDCLPDLNFFSYCQNLLQKYRNENKVFAISGFSAKDDSFRDNKESFYFSKFFGMWGWATWKRVWQNYDFKMSDWSTLRENNWIHTEIPDSKIAKQKQRDYDNVFLNNGKRGIVDTWDFQFEFAMIKNNGLCIKPCGNLIRNIGIGTAGATHTKLGDKLSKRDFEQPPIPLKYPREIAWNKEVDINIFKKYYLKSEIAFKIKRLIKKIPILAKILNTLFLVAMDLVKLGVRK